MGSSGLGVNAVLRSVTGGVFMGLANLVPGISGGTMLLATGVYRHFVDAVASISSLRINKALILTLVTIGVPAALSILLFAGVVRDLVLNHRWVMYSLFIGLTLGGVPVIFAELQSTSKRLILPFLAGVAVMVGVALIKPGDPAQGESILILLAAGILGASAMVLPGISGGYILLVMGQYVTILSGIDHVKIGLRTQDVQEIVAGLKICIPVGLGVVSGVVLVSHLIRYFFKKFETETYGVLLGLLVGAVFGLWPFQSPVFPKIGDVIRGQQLLTVEMLEKVDPKYYAVEFFTPSGLQIGLAFLLILCGFTLTVAIDRFGRRFEAAHAGSPKE